MYCLPSAGISLTGATSITHLYYAGRFIRTSAPIGWVIGTWNLFQLYLHRAIIPGAGLLLEGYVNYH